MRALLSSTTRVRSVRRPIGGSEALLAGAVVLLFVAMVRSAWLSDDGLITFRTLDHFVNGDGLRFNLAERVQSYTHPLWLLLLAPFYFVTREAFYTPMLVSLAVSGLAVLVFARFAARSSGVAAAGVLCLCASKAFVDYTTSGLENPLTYALVAVWLSVYLASADGGPAPSPGRFGLLVGVTSLLFVNRMDSVLLVAPALFVVLASRIRHSTGARGWLLPASLGALPAVAWVGFAVLYYGTPFANTAYAKLATGIEPWLLREQGLFYLWHAVRYDPVTPALIALALVAGITDGIRRRRWAFASLASGLALQLLYVVEVGGDFMMGRFLSVPFFAAVILLSRASASSRVAGAVGVASVLVSLASPLSPLRSGSDYENRNEQEVIENRGISDERGFYYARRGLLARAPERVLVPGSRCGEERGSVVVRTVCGELGYEGFTGCRELFLADRCALSDALLARMPLIDTAHWRVGHFFRRVPRGYAESLASDANEIFDPRIRALYEDVRLATRAPLFARGRLGAILRLHFSDPDLPPTGPRVSRQRR